jgi:hypothetical protein
MSCGASITALFGKSPGDPWISLISDEASYIEDA